MKVSIPIEIKDELKLIVSKVKFIPLDTVNLGDYFNFLESLEQFEGWKHPGTHVHHIIPRCLFSESTKTLEFLNSWESGNLVRLTLENHAKAHDLLFKSTYITKLAFAKPLLTCETHNLGVILSHTPEAIAKRKATMMKRYGNTEGPCHNKESRAKASPKAVQTIIERFGSFQNCLRSPEVNMRLAAEHGGDPYWHIHTQESHDNRSKNTGTPIYKVDVNTGEILHEYWGINRAAKEEGTFSNSRLKVCIRRGIPFKGYYWIKKSEYEQWYDKFSSTTKTTN